jgi:hypothetical protein
MNVLKRHVLRNILWGQILIIFIVVGFFVGKASAEPNPKNGPATTQARLRYPEYVTPEKLAVLATTTTTTTTTTTVPPTRRKVQETPKAVQTSVAVPQGDWVAQCHAWAKLAGIDLTPAAITLIDRESDCNPNAQNPNSTAYGIGQFLNSTWAGVGCVKTSDPVEQLRCMDRYVVRHGGWDGALAHSYSKGWY